MIMVLIGNENLIVIFNNYVQTQTNELMQTNELTLLNNLKIRSVNGRPRLHRVHLHTLFHNFIVNNCTYDKTKCHCTKNLHKPS